MRNSIYRLNLRRRESFRVLRTILAAIVLGLPLSLAHAAVTKTTVNSDDTVTFFLSAPGASSVSVSFYTAASAAGQVTPLVPGDRGSWSVTLGPYPPGNYAYQFIVDGLGVADPGTSAYYPGITVNYSLVLIPGDPPSFIDDQDVPHGELHHHYINSSVFQQVRPLFVYTPPGYKPGVRYPVLYLYHGAFDQILGWITVGRAPQILDNLLATRDARPMIIVIPETFIPGAGSATTGSYQLIDQELTTEIIPFVEKHYGTGDDSEDHALVGFSEGAGQSLYSALSHPEYFGTLGLWSFFPITSIPTTVTAAKINKIIKRFDIIVGSNDQYLSRDVTLDSQLTSLGINHTYTVVPGAAHTWEFWRDNLHEFLPTVFPRQSHRYDDALRCYDEDKFHHDERHHGGRW